MKPRSNREKCLKFCLIMTWGAAASLQATTVIDSIVAWNGSDYVSSFGAGWATATYGQTITAPVSDTNLQSFTFVLSLPASTTFQGYVYAWDGLKATGPALYTSSVEATAGVGMQQITFNTGGLGLTSGGSYVLFASTAGVAGSSGDGVWGFSYATDPYAAGTFVYLNHSSPADWTTSTWSSFGDGKDLAFNATFDAVPEPSSAALLGLGTLTMLVRRRR